MSYRDDRDALRARVQELEHEIERVREDREAEEAERDAEVEALEGKLQRARRQLERVRRGPKRQRQLRSVVMLGVGVVVGILVIKMIGAIRTGDPAPGTTTQPRAGEGAAVDAGGDGGAPTTPEHEPCPRRTVGTTRLSDPVLVVEPGQGVGPVRIGRSTVQEVVDAFGDDCVLHRYASGEVFQISYLYDREGAWQQDRETQRRVPNLVDIEQGVVRLMSFGAFQRNFRTLGGVTTDSSMADMVAEFGEEYRHTERERLDSYDYVSKGIEFWVSRANQQINSFRIRAPRPKQLQDEHRPADVQQ